MEQNVALEIARQGMMTGFMVCLPILAVALFVGLLVSVFQAVTQVQEMTLTYVPKLIGVGLVVVFFGGWMLTTLVSFTRLCFDYAARVMGG
ncbi:MAG TPA: flagellar biosynthesis protein FliQ [Fimbriimonadaceae bacterium]|nr:flagellar biosynthesis protein FliQ [Fimbriimonadaceae bacterium]